MVFCHLQCIEVRVLCRKTSVGSNIGQENHLRRTMIEQIIQNPVVGWWDLKTIRQKSETYFTCASQNIIIMVTFLLCPNTPTRTRWLSPPAKWANGHKGILLHPWKNEIFVIKHSFIQNEKYTIFAITIFIYVCCWIFKSRTTNRKPQKQTNRSI